METINKQLLDSQIKPVSISISCSSDVEMDEMWSYVKSKKKQRWLFHAIDRSSNKILAFVIGSRTKTTLKKLLDKLSAFKIEGYYTDNWKPYKKVLPSSKHFIGKENNQSIERKHLTLRTRIKRLCRKTICYSKVNEMHDAVIGLFINKFEFCKDIW